VVYDRDGELEYDLVLAAGVDPASVRLAVSGADAAASPKRATSSSRAATRRSCSTARAPSR